MSDYAKIFPAVIQWIKDDPALFGKNGFTGVFDDVPRKGQEFPYLVMTNITSNYSPGTSQEVDEDIYQFSGFDGNTAGKQRSSKRIMELMALLEDRLHNQPITIPGVTLVRFTRDTKNKLGNRSEGWLCWQRYRCETQDA